MRIIEWVVQVSLLLGALPLLFVFVLLPLLIYFCPHVMQNLFFLNFRKIPMTDYENVSANNVKSTGRSFYLQGICGHGSLSARYHDKNIIPTGEEMEESLSKEVYPVVLYAHGNSFDRTIDHRCQLYNVLNDMNYQVIAFDYRGYGDSEGTPTEEGLVADSRLVFEYLRKKVGKNLLIIWGHSMGTGVSTKLVQDLSKESKAPDGLILESPFNNLHDAVMNHPFSFNIEQTLIAMGFSPIRWMPDTLVNLLILNPLRSVGLNMNSDQRIVDITCPIFIIHAEDDHVIPAKLGRLLRDAAKQAERDVEYLEFPSNRQFKHKFIYLADELPAHVRTFFAKCDKLRHGNNSQRLD
ncbi:unnamed protein product, partial [Mesorhabditis belari]|uniref:Serine aminopeptidase S33 domain-containing protein n=1 Tax=Mesorhabditis belari TaxID=2138241 RepID=A0AAF3FRW3_9BILA